MKGRGVKRSKCRSKEEPELSQEEKNIIMDSAIAFFEKKRVKRKKYWNPLLSDYLSKNKVLIQYVYDLYGYPKGVVVSIAKDHFGWSLVSNRDVVVQRLDPMKLPVIQKLIRAKAPVEEIIQTKAYLRALKDHCAIPIPIFDPNIGVFVALGRSLTSKISKSSDEAGTIGIQSKPPNDAELLTALTKIAVRAQRYFK
jgi:hypothetical protein